VEVEAEEVEVAVLDVRVVVDDEGVVAVVEVVKVDEEGVVVLDVELVKALVVEEVEADVLGLVDALDPVEDVEVLVWVPECSMVVDECWKSTSAVSTPARRTSATPAMSATVPSRPTRRGDFLPDNLSLVPCRRRALFCLPLDHCELREARSQDLGLLDTEPVLEHGRVSLPKVDVP